MHYQSIARGKHTRCRVIRYEKRPEANGIGRTSGGARAAEPWNLILTICGALDKRTVIFGRVDAYRGLIDQADHNRMAIFEHA